MRPTEPWISSNEIIILKIIKLGKSGHLLGYHFSRGGRTAVEEMAVDEPHFQGGGKNRS